MGLDAIWWLVSPQNPLKPERGMAPFARRLAWARGEASDPRIRVVDVEAALGTTYTAETLTRLVRRHPGLRFVWIMGADNLAQIASWAGWERIFLTVPIAVYDRPSYSQRALDGLAARRFAKARLPEASAKRLALCRPPAWIFFPGRYHPASATEIRARRRQGGA